MATEVVSAQLLPGKSPEDANSQAGQVLKDTLDTLTEQKGFQRAYWGTEVESSSTFRLFVDWDSVDDHINFTKAEHYGPFVDRFGQAADVKTLSFVHVHFKPHPASQALSDHSSPVTQVSTVYFSPDISESDQKKYHETFTKHVQSINDKSDKATGAANGGWGVEQLDIPGTSEKAKVYVGVVGWRSIEDATAFQGSNEYQESHAGFKDFEKLVKHTNVKHVSLTQVQPGAGGVGDASDGNALSAQEEILNPQSSTKAPPKTRADGTTTKNNDDLKGTTNSTKKERSGR